MSRALTVGDVQGAALTLLVMRVRQARADAERHDGIPSEVAIGRVQRAVTGARAHGVADPTIRRFIIGIPAALVGLEDADADAS